MSPVKNHVDVCRHGFMLIEFLIALGFIALVTGLTLKMHLGRVELDRKQMQRMTDQLAVENIAERLTIQPYAEVSDYAKELSGDPKLNIEVISFESSLAVGLHCVITMESENEALRHDVWRLESGT